MTFWRHAPHAGWYVLLTLTLCILAVAHAAFEHRRAVRLSWTAKTVLDSLGALECVLVKPGSDVRLFPPRDTLRRAVP